MWRRSEWELKRAVRAALFVATMLFVLLVLPDAARACWTLAPARLRIWWAEALAFTLVIGYLLIACVATFGSDQWQWQARAKRALDRIHSWALYACGRGLPVSLSIACILLLLSWMPHYLTWPWSRDEDTFCVLAMSWDRGILPYRDIRAYNFPGETYLFWLLGKVFGWGRTAPFYFVDSSCVVIFGLALVYWSRQRLGGVVPGLIAYLAFLSFYLNQAFEITGERDWHTVFLVSVGLLVSQAWPGKRSRRGSAVLCAIAFVIRPQAVLFLPAVVSSIMETQAGADGNWSAKGRAAREWIVWFAGFSMALWSPVLVAGIGDDLIRGLRVAIYGGPYSRMTPSGAFDLLIQQLRNWRTSVPLVATLIFTSRRDERLAAMARTWLWAWVGALVYRPLSPIPHQYLIHPLFVVGSITLAFATYCLVCSTWLPRPMQVLAVLLLAYEVIPQSPWMCDPVRSAEAVRLLVLGETPDVTPPGCVQCFHGAPNPTPWQSYCALLRYLRESTRSETVVANVLNRYPMESLNGPTGRLSPFLAESGICWMQWVKIDLDGEFARQLESTPDSVVVWDSRQKEVDPKMKLAAVVEVVRRCYEPDARFGKFEVWRRKKAAKPVEK